MRQVNTVTSARRRRSWLVAMTLIPALVLGLSACGGRAEAPQPQVITDKGTPFGDLLIPKLLPPSRTAPWGSASSRR